MHREMECPGLLRGILLMMLSHQKPNQRHGCTLYWTGNEKKGQAMNNIIQFPNRIQASTSSIPEQRFQKNWPLTSCIRIFLAGLLKGVWVVVVLVWPLLKWLASIEVFFQLIRMIYLWNTPGTHAVWTFAGHFALLAALTYFVSVFKPKGF